MKLNQLIDREYLLSTNEKFKYWYIYLSFFGGLVFLAFLVSLIFRRQEDYEAKKSLQKQFFWVYISFGLLGLASVFARAQILPVFGNRITTFIILGLFFAANVYLIIYFFKVTKKEQLKLAQKKRKAKWLKKN